MTRYAKPACDGPTRLRRSPRRPLKLSAPSREVARSQWRRRGPTAPECRATRSGRTSPAVPALPPDPPRTAPIQGQSGATTTGCRWTRPVGCSPPGTGRGAPSVRGYDRELTRYPVRYPTACSPQAWSTGAILLLLRTMLGMESRGDFLVNRPAVPVSVGRIELLGIPGRWGRADALGRGRLG